jgi:hypothetical protein
MPIKAYLRGQQKTGRAQRLYPEVPSLRQFAAKHDEDVTRFRDRIRVADTLNP